VSRSDQFSEEPEDLPHEPRIFPITALRGMKRIHSGVFSPSRILHSPIIWSRWTARFFPTFREWYMVCGRHKETSPSLRTPSCRVLVTRPHFVDRFTRWQIPTWSRIVCALDLYRRAGDLTFPSAFAATLFRRVDDNVADSLYNYIPTEWMCIVFVALFGVSTCELSFLPCQRTWAESRKSYMSVRRSAIACGGCSRLLFFAD